MTPELLAAADGGAPPLGDLRGRIQADLFAALPEHFRRLGWAPDQLRDWQRGRLRRLLAAAISRSASLRQAHSAASTSRDHPRPPCGAGSFLDGPAHGSQVIAETQGRCPLALGKVAVELHLSAQGGTCAELSGLAPLGVADRLGKREDFPGAAGRHEQHAIVIAQGQVLPVHGPVSHRGAR
jgi:hypothetical protein